MVFEQQRCRLTVAEQFGYIDDRLFVDFGTGRSRVWLHRTRTFAPGRVGARNQRGDPAQAAAMVTQAGADGVGAVPGQAVAGRAGFDPAGIIARQGFDVGSQRRIESDVVMRMVADDIDHR